MKNPNNQHTLFRFVSLRSPELSKQENQEKRFIFHFDGVSGNYFNPVATRVAGKTKWETMRSIVPATLFEKETDLDAITFAAANVDFIKITKGLAENKTTLKPVDFIGKTKTLKPLDESTLETLWDNLFYQVVTQKSFYVKEAIIELLLLNHLVKNTVGILPKDIDILVPVLINARVVLPTSLFEEEAGISGLIAKNEKNAVKNISPRKRYLQQMKYLLLKKK